MDIAKQIRLAVATIGIAWTLLGIIVGILEGDTQFSVMWGMVGTIGWSILTIVLWVATRGIESQNAM